MTLAFNSLLMLFLLSGSAIASNCNPSFMVCADDNGYAHWSGQRSDNQQPIKRHTVTGKKTERLSHINSEIQRCLPYEYHEIMKKIVKVESGGNPYAININGGAKLSRQPQNYYEAVSTANYLISQGYSIDMGMAQINSQHFSKKGFLYKIGITVEDIFDSCTNLRAGAKVFGDAYLKNNSNIVSALSAYNTGSPVRGIQNGYVNKVLAQ